MPKYIIHLPYIVCLCDTIHRLQDPVGLSFDCFGNYTDSGLRLDRNPVSCRNRDGGHHETVIKFCVSTPLRPGEVASPQKSCLFSGNKKKIRI